MVELRPVVIWSGIQMVVWKPEWKMSVNGPKCPVFKWLAESRDLTFWILSTQSVWYSDESSIWMSSIQMVTVLNIQDQNNIQCSTYTICFSLADIPLHKQTETGSISLKIHPSSFSFYYPPSYGIASCFMTAGMVNTYLAF